MDTDFSLAMLPTALYLFLNLCLDVLTSFRKIVNSLFVILYIKILIFQS